MGVPFDTATTNRPGARLGPRGLRNASTIMAWEKPYGTRFDPFDKLAVADIGAGDGKTVGMDRIGRVRHQHRITRAHGGQRQVGQSLLGAYGDNGMPVVIQIDIIASAIPVADRLAQPRNAARQ